MRFSNLLLQVTVRTVNLRTPPASSSLRAGAALLLGSLLTALSVNAEPLRARAPVVLTTRTPMGVASIEIPADTPLETCETAGDWLSVRSGPFSGWVALKDTNWSPPPEPVRDEPPQAELPQAEPPQAEPPQATAPPAAVQEQCPFGPGLPAKFLLAALAGWAMLASIGWLLLRRKCARLDSRIAQLQEKSPTLAVPPAPSSADPVPADPVPADPVPADPVPAEPVPAEPVPAEPVPAEPAAEPTAEENPPPAPSIACPLCGTMLAQDSLAAGKITCPACAGTFLCE
ncbi:MAG: hypothetical protein WCS65_02350 [Verrucomicrobiae bacterium]